jgi:hypothetical protein
MVPRAGLDAVKQRKMSCPCRELNHGRRLSYICYKCSLQSSREPTAEHASTCMLLETEVPSAVFVI